MWKQTLTTFHRRSSPHPHHTRRSHERNNFHYSLLIFDESCWFFTLPPLSLLGCNFFQPASWEEFKVVKLWFALCQTSAVAQKKVHEEVSCLSHIEAGSSTKFSSFRIPPLLLPHPSLIYGRKTKASMRESKWERRLCNSSGAGLSRAGTLCKTTRERLDTHGSEKKSTKTEKKTYPLET